MRSTLNLALIAAVLMLAPLAVKADDMTFTYADSIVTYTVPTTGVYEIAAYGAQGGASSNAVTGNFTSGGEGAEVNATYSLDAGTTLLILVGGQGGEGGGNGGGGGGGGSFVAVGSTPSGSTLLVAAGGGGGAGSSANGVAGQASFNGAGADTIGGGGGSNGGGGSPGYSGGGGGGGFAGSGGYGGSDFLGCLLGVACGAGGGSFESGGAGGAGGDYTQPNVLYSDGGNGGYGGGGGGGSAYDGGGGGGYSGGGGGDEYAAGGGGGSYANLSLEESGTTATWQGGVQSFNGEVILTDLSAPATTPTPEPASFLLFGTGLIGLAALLHRRSRREKEAARCPQSANG